MNTSKIKDLINKALKEDFYDKVDLSVGMGKDLLDREDVIRKASMYGSKLDDTKKMLKYATRVGDTDKMAQASEAYKATRLAQALGDDDIKFIVDHADVLNKQGKNALIQLLLERNDTANLYGLNKNLGNEFINKDLKNKVGRDKAKLLDEAVANNELQQKFYSKLDDDETAAELRGMSVDPRTDPARSRLIADRMRNGQTVDTSVDEMFNADITDKQLAKHPRYQKWIADEERRLKGKVPSSPIKDVHPTRPQELKRNRASDIKDLTEILEGAINNRYGSVANLRNTLKDVPEGSERFYDEAADLLNRYDNAMDEASNPRLRDELGDIDEDNVFNQFIDPRDQERIKPTPRSRDFGEESLMLRDNELADRFFRAREAKGMKKERDLPARTVNRIRGIKQTPDDRRKELIELASKSENKDVPVYRGGEKPAYFTTEKEALKDIYPKKFRGYGESTREYLTPETEALFKEVDDRARRAKRKIRDKYESPMSKDYEVEDYAMFAKGKGKPSFEAERKMHKELEDIDTKSESYKAKHKQTRVETSDNKIPGKSGVYKNPLDDIATEVFIKNVAKGTGRKPTATQIARLKNMSKEQVIDIYENLAHPSKYKVKNPKQTQLGKLMDDIRKLPEGKSAEEFDTRVTKEGGKYWVEFEDDVLPGEWDLHDTAFNTPDEVYRFLVKESFLGMNRPKMHR